MSDLIHSYASFVSSSAGPEGLLSAVAWLQGLKVASSLTSFKWMGAPILHLVNQAPEPRGLSIRNRLVDQWNVLGKPDWTGASVKLPWKWPNSHDVEELESLFPEQRKRGSWSTFALDSEYFGAQTLPHLQPCSDCESQRATVNLGDHQARFRRGPIRQPCWDKTQNSSICTTTSCPSWRKCPSWRNISYMANIQPRAIICSGRDNIINTVSRTVPLLYSCVQPSRFSRLSDRANIHSLQRRSCRHIHP